MDTAVDDLVGLCETWSDIAPVAGSLSHLRQCKYTLFTYAHVIALMSAEYDNGNGGGARGGVYAQTLPRFACHKYIHGV